MPYRIKVGEAVRPSVRRIVVEQIDRAVAEIDNPRLDTDVTVHQVRKRCKKIRAVLRLVRVGLPAATYARENAFFRDTARRLSDVRDAAAMRETYEKLMKTAGDAALRRRFAPVRRALRRRCRQLLAKGTDLDQRLAEVRQALQAARRRVARWAVPEKDFAALAGGLAKTYRRGRNGLGIAYAEPTDVHFHTWRKRVKYHRYHVRLLRKMWAPLLKARRAELQVLSDLLGDDHDLAVLAAALRESPGDFGPAEQVRALRRLVARRRAVLQKEARPLGQRLFAEKPSRLAERYGVYWQAWRGPRKSRRARCRPRGRR